MTKAVLLQLMGMLVSTNHTQIAKINQLNQVSIKVLRKIVQENDRATTTSTTRTAAAAADAE